MKKQTLILLTLVFLVCFLSCSDKSNKYSSQFDQKIWLENSEVGNGLSQNTRAGKIDDLIENHLEKGMTKSDIIELLGNPYKDGIELRLPANIKVPDSLDIISTVGKSKEIREEMLDHWNNWYAENSQPDTLMLYAAGWSLIDPNFLVVKLDDKEIVNDFWLEQH